MSNPLFNTSLADIHRELTVSLVECNRRGLGQTAKWLAELKFGIVRPPGADINVFPTVATTGGSSTSPISAKDQDAYDIAKSYFDFREYDRCHFFLESTTSPAPKFLYYYSEYMAKEKRRLDNLTDEANLTEIPQLTDLHELYNTLKEMHPKRKLDGYMLYLYGVLLKKFDLKDAATLVLVESVNAVPTLWCSWIELGPLLTNKEQMVSLNLPNHWMKSFFAAHTHIELFLNDEGLELFEELKAAGFQNSTYITAQIAIAYHNKRSELVFYIRLGPGGGGGVGGPTGRGWFSQRCFGD